MKKPHFYKFIAIIFFGFQFGFSQVDIIYNDLVWSDEFNVNGTISASNWFQQTQLPSGGSWFNGELQHYTNRIDNAFVNAGELNIVAKKEIYTNQGFTKNYTSARLNSKFPFKYGRVDVRAKVPINVGTWSAIWMLGKNINEDGAFYDVNFGAVNWPACGEIDIMERGIFPSQPADYIQATLHTPSSFGNSVNNGWTLASNLQNTFHVYSMNWSPFQISFLLDNVVFYTYNPLIKNANTWPFDNEQYLLLNIAMGGTAGTIPSNFTQAAMQIDYVRVYQNTMVDTQNPTNFTASIGAITNSTIELLLNANDNSGNVVYTISYGNTTFTIANASGIQKSVIIPNLNPNTNYVFTIAAADVSGNNYANNPIIINATTSATLGCFGTDSIATQGSFTTGYNYNFETLGTDVKITFELLDTDKVGVVAYLWKQNPFSETQMTNVSGNIFTKTITGQTLGSTINYAVKFAYAGGLSVTKYCSYVVGNNCSLVIDNNNLSSEITFNNPANDFVIIDSKFNIDKIEIYNLLGNLVSINTANTNKIDVTDLSKGIYLLIIYSGDNKIVKKLIKE